MINDLYDEAAEVAVLGAVLVRGEAMDDLVDLEPEHFRRTHHTQIFRAMRVLHAGAKPIDPITLRDALAKMGVLEDVGGASVLLALADGVPRSTNVAHYAAIVKDKAILRSLCHLGRRLVEEAEDMGLSGTDLLEFAEQEIFKLGQKATATEWASAPELAAEVFQMVESLNGDESRCQGWKTTFHDLDRATRGLQNGDLVLLGARPSMGKTALMMACATNPENPPAPAAVFSAEMAKGALSLRSVVSIARVDSFRLMSGFASEMDLKRIGDAVSAFGEKKLFIDDATGLSPTVMRSKLRRLQARVGKLGLVAVDYLQLMAPNPEDRRENRNNQLAGISRSLKLMAREFNVPFLVLSQLSRGFERTADSRPQMSDLRDSGALEQDADVVLLLHRPEYYDKDDASLEGLAEVIIAKQRNGPTGTVKLAWQKHYTRFDNMAPEYQQEQSGRLYD